MRLGLQLAQRPRLPLAERVAGADDRIVEFGGVAQIELAERREDLGPRLFVQPGGHKPDLHAVRLQRQQKILQPRRRRERIRAAAALQDLAHLEAGDVVVVAARGLDRLARAVFADAVLQMLAHGMARHVRLVGGLQPERGIAHEAGDRLLDDPHPEALAVDARAVEIHQHGRGRRLEPRGLERIDRRIAHRGFDVDERLVRVHEQLHLAVARNEDALDAVAPRAKASVAARLRLREVGALPHRHVAQSGYRDHAFASRR